MLFPLIVIVAVDAAVGVPEITPVDEFNTRPVGNVPDKTEYETVWPAKYVAEKAVDGVIGEFRGPEIVCVEGEIVRTPMLNVTVVDAVPDVSPVAVIVTVADDASVGVPEIEPPEGFNVKPAGRVPAVTA